MRSIARRIDRCRRFALMLAAPRSPVRRRTRGAPAPLTPERPRHMGATSLLRVYVMTMSPGDHPFFRFGHNAILIRDFAKRDREGLQLRDVPLRFAADDLRFPGRPAHVLAVGVVAARRDAHVPAREPQHHHAGAAAAARDEAGAAGGAGRQRAARQARVQVRLLPRQLLDARARCRRPRRGRAAASERARARPADACASTRCA